MSEQGDAPSMFSDPAEIESLKHIRRLAVVVQNSSMSMTAAGLRSMIPTYSTVTLEELRIVLTRHQQRQWEVVEGRDVQRGPECVGVDLTQLPIEDTRLFASQLRGASQIGVVYVITPAQFELFEDGTFDFVVR